MIKLGPRTIKFEHPDGSAGEISFDISVLDDVHIDLGEGDHTIRKSGSMRISAPWLEKTMTFQAEDDIQLIARLIWLSDLYVRKLCADNQIKIYKWEPGDISANFSIYLP